MPIQHFNNFRLLPTLLLVIAACRDPLPCDDCVGDEDADDQGESVPDLPCGGADLLTDSQNCGTCGNVCDVAYEGTDWEAGTCQAGVCGPSWTTCWPAADNIPTCEAFCAVQGLTCVPAGCSGMTAMLHHAFPFMGCIPASGPDATMTGPCTDPIPWETTDDWELQAQCCCG